MKWSCNGDGDATASTSPGQWSECNVRHSVTGLLRLLDSLQVCRPAELLSVRLRCPSSVLTRSYSRMVTIRGHGPVISAAYAGGLALHALHVMSPSVPLSFEVGAS